MAHFARLDENNIVIKVHRVNNDIATSEQAGIDFLKKTHASHDPSIVNATFKQTSYNTQAGQHRLNGTPFRKNYAGIGHTYDATRDAFIPPQPFPSWTLNETTCQYDPPIEKPVTYTEVDGVQMKEVYDWNEENQTWDKVTL